MREPIKAGDTCRIVRGLAQSKSPNLRLVVTVGPTIMGNHGAPHSRFGRIVRIEGKGVCQMNDAGQFVETGWADIPVDWLEKIDPDAPPPAGVKTDREVSA